MKILFVAMSNSIHTIRWIRQITGLGWDIHLFVGNDSSTVHPELEKLVDPKHIYCRKEKKKGIFRFLLNISKLISISKNIIFSNLRNRRHVKLRRIISKIKPDVIHSLEIQHAGYLTLSAKDNFNGEFPPWIVTNWGSDIYLFGRLAEHEPKIREVLKQCDYYSCECYRDVELAKKYGFKGRVLPVFPNTGGFDLKLIFGMRKPGPTSDRRLIMLKGYQTWSGRALVGLRALERCVDMLDGYEIAIYSAGPQVLIAAELFQTTTGIPVTIIPPGTSHDEILKYHGRSRISIGLGISDAISTSLLEALAMGSFPIQSWTACADEWIEDGKAGILVPPEDPEIVEQAIRTALSDDDLVNTAAEINYKITEERLDQDILGPMAVDIYGLVAGVKGNEV